MGMETVVWLGLSAFLSGFITAWLFEDKPADEAPAKARNGRD